MKLLQAKLSVRALFQANSSKKRFEVMRTSEAVSSQKALSKMPNEGFKSSFQVPSGWGFYMGPFPDAYVFFELMLFLDHLSGEGVSFLC